MKNIIVQYIIFIVITLVIFITIRELTDKRPFKFEKYNYDNFNSVIQKRFPIGTDVDEVIEILIASNIDNIRIMKIEHKYKYGYMKDAVYTISFFYYTAFLSLSFGSSYTTDIQIDKNRKIIDIRGNKASFLSEFWW